MCKAVWVLGAQGLLEVMMRSCPLSGAERSLNNLSGFAEPRRKGENHLFIFLSCFLNLCCALCNVAVEDILKRRWCFIHKDKIFNSRYIWGIRSSIH